MTDLYVHHHLGLGDHLHCNGMVRYILKDDMLLSYDKVGVFAKSSYYDMVKYMYRDDDSIEVIEIDGNNEYQDVYEYMMNNSDSDFLRVGHENYPGPGYEEQTGKNCCQIFYEQVGIPYDVHYDMFHIERDLDEEKRVYDKLNPSGEPFIFVHDDPDRGHTLDRSHFLNSKLKVIENDLDENIFHFIKILENAKEIHCMESCFKILVEFFSTTDKLFFHDFRGHPLGANKKEWTVINYA